MRKLVIIPAYNESGSIQKTIKDIRENAPDFDYIVINDCSRQAIFMPLSTDMTLPSSLTGTGSTARCTFRKWRGLSIRERRIW